MSELSEAMIVLVLLALGAAALLLTTPRLMMLLMWTVILCYPQNLFFGLLPWNAGLDDIFVVLVALRMLFYTPRGEASPLAWGAIFVAIGMMTMLAISDFTGGMQLRQLLPLALKDTLKGVVLVLFTLAMARDIRNTRTIHQHILAFSLAMSLSFLLVIACSYNASLAGLFDVLTEEQLWKADITGASKRAAGPYTGAQGVGTAVCVAVPLAIGLLLHKPRRRFIMPMALLLLATSLGALLVAKSRSGLFGLAGMFALMAMFSRQRAYIIGLQVIVILGVAIFLAGGEFFGAYQERLSLERLQYDLVTRVAIWKETIANPSPWIIFCGEGSRQHVVRFEMSPHSGYLDILFLWGMGGVVMFTILIWKSLKWSSLTQRFDPDSCCRAIAWGFRWSIVAAAVLAISTGPWYREFYRMMIYFLLVIVCTRFLMLRAQHAIPVGAGGMYLESPAATREGLSQDTTPKYL